MLCPFHGLQVRVSAVLSDGLCAGCWCHHCCFGEDAHLPQSSLLLVPNNPESYVVRLALESTYDTQTNAARGWPLNCGQSLVVAAHERATTLCTTKRLSPQAALRISTNIPLVHGALALLACVVLHSDRAVCLFIFICCVHSI